MPLGYGLLWVALVATVAANLLFTLSRRAGRESLFVWAQRAALLATVSVVGASVYLSYLIWNHQFQVAYVAEYSAKRSAAKYLLAAFWGGQEGSILLWTLWTTLLGVFLAFHRGTADKTNRAWPIFGVLQVFLIGFLLIKCPFALGKGPVPNDGRGLNPLLENPWMVIHPPMLFLGFASTAMPFVWAVYGLLYRDWNGWIRPGFASALFSFAWLGFGIALGGYWAYETLGWGGFWGWDPVENSSLVPWLALTALLHGLAIQRSNGGFRIGNFLLATLPFAAMFYGTFLTRTGLLDGFSVHSFSSLGTDGFYILQAGVLTAFFGPIALVLWRIKSIPRESSYENATGREFGYLSATVLLGLTGIAVAIGMSAPILTRTLWQWSQVAAFSKNWFPAWEKGTGILPEFYNQYLYWIALPLLVAMAVTPYLAWRSTDIDKMLKRLWPAYAIAIALTLGMLLAGSRNPLMLLLFAASMFTVVSNLFLLAPRLRRREGRASIGGHLAHVGAGLLLAGVACLVTFGRSQNDVMLLRDKPVEALGFKITYLGMTAHPWDRNNALRLRMEKGGKVWEAAPAFYFAPWAGKDTLFANPPAILPNVYQLKSGAELLPWNHPLPFGDFYIAWKDGPSSIAPMLPSPNKGWTAQRGKLMDFGAYRFTLRDLDTTEVEQAGQSMRQDAAFVPPTTWIRATVEVERNGKTEVVRPALRLEPVSRGGKLAGLNFFMEPAELPVDGGQRPILLLQPPTEEEANSQAPFAVHLQTYNVPDMGEAISLDLSTKPMISLVWAGTLLYTLGGLMAWRRRGKELNLLPGAAGNVGLTETESSAKAIATEKNEAERDSEGKPGDSAKFREKKSARSAARR